MRTARFFFSILFASALTFCSLDASAQRLIPGQMTVYGEGAAWMAPGGGAGVSFIKRGFKWDFSANYRTLGMDRTLPETKAYGEGRYEWKNQDIYARLMYKGLVAHDRSYTWNLWLGISFDPGARIRSNIKYLPEYEGYSGDEDDGRVSYAAFIYGFSPEISLEFFPSSIFSMSVFARPRLMFSGEKEKLGERWFYPEFGMQFDFCFFKKR